MSHFLPCLRRWQLDSGQERSKRQSHILVQAKLRQNICAYNICLYSLYCFAGIIAAHAVRRLSLFCASYGDALAIDPTDDDDDDFGYDYDKSHW